jgi:hypothetical protein
MNGFAELEAAQLRRAIREAKRVFIRGGDWGIFRVSKAEALRTIKSGCVLGKVRVQKFHDYLTVG